MVHKAPLTVVTGVAAGLARLFLHGHGPRPGGGLTARDTQPYAAHTSP